MGIRIQDDARLFGANDTQRIMSANLPFELHVITSTSYASRAGLDARVHDSIDAPNVVGIGIDPTHRWVVAHFGTGTGIAPSTWATIVASGNGDFRDARWGDGVLAVSRSAANARTEASVSTAAYEDESSSAGVFIVGGFALAVLLLVWLLVRRARRAANVVVDGSSNDLLTGYVMGSAMHPTTVVEHHVVHDTASHGASTSFGGSFDSGGTFGGGGGGFDGGGAGSSF
jgi:MYXO-CTERM domain-containing protein